MRKFLALVLALVMTMSLVTVSAGAATDFVDDAKITNAEAVEVLNAMGILGGYPDGTYRPEATLSRGAGAKILAYLTLGQAKADKLTATYTVFEDVDDTVLTAPYIEWAANLGIVGGYADGTFGPYKPLSQFAFGKMLLGALRYDAAVEGYTGATWDKSVYADATKIDIFDGTETNNTACTRDDAARMALAALKANFVVYGTGFADAGDAITLPNGTVIAVSPMVEGCFETDVAMWREYPGLRYDELAADVYGRPGHKWTYNTTATVGVEFQKFYMDAPIATYTESVTECDLLVAAGVAKTSTTPVNVYYFRDGALIDGAAVAHRHDAACTTATFGNQGTLTQVFAVGNDLVVTEIDTNLASVDALVKNTHNAVGVTELTVYENAGTKADLDANLAVTVNADMGYALNTMLLVNRAVTSDPVYTDVAQADAYAYQAATGAADYVNVVGLPTVISGGRYTGVAADKSVAKVNGVLYNTAKHYDLSSCQLLDTTFGTYDFYVDQYGNLIGDAIIVAPYDFVVIQKSEWQQVLGVLNAGYADFAAVNAAGELKAYTVHEYNDIVMTDGNGTSNLGTATLSQNWQDNGKYYETAPNYGIVKAYELATGGYDFVAVADDATTDIKHDTGVTITKGNPNFGKGTPGIWNVADENTVFVVKYLKADLTIGYKSYTGISAMESVSEATYTAVYDLNGDNDMNYADFVFVDLTNGGYFTQDSTVAFVINPAKTGTYVDANYYTYNVYINGALTTVNSADANLFGTNAGVYTLNYDAEGHVLKATTVTEFVLTNGTTFAGTVGAGGKYVADTIVAESAESVVIRGAAYNTAGAKVYFVNYVDALDADNGTWSAADVVTSVSVASVADLNAGAQVIYVENAATVGVNDIAVAFVMNGIDANA